MSKKLFVAAVTTGSLIAGGIVLVLRADATSDEQSARSSQAPASSSPTTPTTPHAPRPHAPTVADDGTIETSRATDPAPSPADRVERLRRLDDTGVGAATEPRAPRTGERRIQIPQPTVLNRDETPPDEVRKKAAKIRMNRIIDRAACKAPTPIELSAEARAARDERCARLLAAEVKTDDAAEPVREPSVRRQ